MTKRRSATANAVYHAARRKRWIERNLCSRCGGEKSEAPAFKLCPRCRKQLREIAEAGTIDALMRNDCGHCRTRPHRPGKKWCAMCAENNTRYKKGDLSDA